MPTFLHVGCGPKRKNQTTAEFSRLHWRELRYDIEPSVKPDILGSMLDMSAVKSESVDAVFSSHNIEHLFAYQVPVAPKEFLRVLKPDGYLVITCPDLLPVARMIADDKLNDAAYQSSAGPITPHDILYGYSPELEKGLHYMAHKCGFTLKTMIATLRTHGFATVAGCTVGLDLWAVASKNEMSREKIGKIAGEHLPA
jgi:protein O-GlcNAc transferase